MNVTESSITMEIWRLYSLSAPPFVRVVGIFVMPSQCPLNGET